VPSPCSNNGPLCPLSNAYKYCSDSTSTSASPLLCIPQMLCRPVLLSLPSTVVAFCGSLKLKIKALVRHPRRARKSINEQSIPPNIHEHLPVEMDGKYDRPITEGIAPNQQFPTTADDTSNTPFDSETGLLRSLLELDMPVFGGERTNSASSGVSFSPFCPFYTFAQVSLGLFW
jgi:hypothetical protein